MSAGPYAAPNAKLADVPRPPWAAWKAVLLGLAVDVGGSLGTGAVIGIVYLVYLGSTGVKSEELAARMQALGSDPWLAAIGAIPGGFFSILGGFLCTRLARRADYKVGFVLGAISSLLGLAISFQGHSLLANALLTAATFGSVMLGTRLGFAKTAGDR